MARDIADSDYGSLDILMSPKAPYHIMEVGGRYQVLDADGRNCVRGRPNKGNDFDSFGAAEDWCRYRKLEIARTHLYAE